MARKPKMTKRQQKVAQALLHGAMLRVQKSDPHYFIDGGDAVNERTVKAMLRNGFLRACDDGLFGDSQTLVLASATR